MAGCYGNSKEDRMREAELNRYLDREGSELNFQLKSKAFEKFNKASESLLDTLCSDLGEYIDDDEFEKLRDRMEDLFFNVNQYHKEQ